MARVWFRGDLVFVGGNQWEIPGMSATAIPEIFHNGIILREVAVSPGVTQYMRDGAMLFTPGLDPAAGADFWYIYASDEEVPQGEGSAQSFLTRFNETFYFQVFIKDLQGNLLDILIEEVDGISWSYSTIGGCNEARIVIRRPFDEYGQLDEDYKIEIWRDIDKLGQAGVRLPAVFGPSGIQLGTSHVGERELRWGGYVDKLEPALDEYESVTLHCLGWAQKLERLGVANLDLSGNPVPYVNVDVGVIVRDIIDNWALPGSQIKRTAAFGLVPDTGYIVSNIFFYGYIADALRTLAEMAGDAEWGCRSDGEFFFMRRSQVIKQTHAIGNKIKLYQPLKASDDIVNRVFLQGADGLRATISLGSFVAGNQKERFVTVGSISNPTEATLWATGYSARFGPGVPTSQRLSGRLKIGATARQIEGVGVPLGLLRVIGGPVFIGHGDKLQAQVPFELGHIYGGITDQSFRINSIAYTVTEDNLDVDITLGARSNAVADRVASIERKLSELRQAQQ